MGHAALRRPRTSEPDGDRGGPHRDIIERKAADETLFEEKERAEVTLNSIGDAVISTDISGHVTYLNAVAERMTGWGRKEALGRPLDHVFRIVDGATRETARNPMELAVQLNKTVGLTSNCVLIRRDGLESRIEDSAAPIHNRHGHVTGAVMVFHDVSVARALSLQISHLAQHDFLTDLPNPVLLNDRLTQAIGLARRHGTRLSAGPRLFPSEQRGRSWIRRASPCPPRRLPASNWM